MEKYKLTLSAVGFDTIIVSVENFKQASDTWNKFRDDNFLGASDLKKSSGTIKLCRLKVAEVSYNGRVFDMKGNELI